MDPGTLVLLGSAGLLGYLGWRACTHKDHSEGKRPYMSVYDRDVAPTQKIAAATWPIGQALVFAEDDALFHPVNVPSDALDFWVR